MYLDDFITFIQNTFGDLVEQFEENEEYGFNNPISNEIIRVGFTTNLTPDVVSKAIGKNVQFIITHHDAWDFLYGMKEQCNRMLEENSISHFYIHLPLDFAEFGTCNSLLREIGASIITQQTRFHDNTEIIGIGEYIESMTMPVVQNNNWGRTGLTTDLVDHA